MKNLLLATPLLGYFPSVNEFPWNVDIEMRNDVGEKVIIKEATVSTKILIRMTS